MSFIKDNFFEKDNPGRIQSTRMLQIMSLIGFAVLFVLDGMDKIPDENAARLWVVVFTGIGVYTLNKTKLMR